jgi:dTDP-4-amino-4,6-dideoxygalactose transaminase
VFAEDERSAVMQVLQSGKVNYWTGQEGREFEREYAEYLRRHHAIALGNGTFALELPLRAWGIGPGDDVVVTPRSFIASVSCAVLLGARPVFADVDRDSGNITAESILAVLTPTTRAIIPVHLAGWPCDMDPIMELADARGIRVLEDCAQAHGARYRGRPVGSLAHASAFSFCQDKIMTTGGEGGLLATNDTELWESCWSFKDHGKSWAAMTAPKQDSGFRWVHEHFGTNMRMTELQAAIGRLQLRKLDNWVGARRRNSAVLRERLRRHALLRVPEPASDFQHAYYKFYAYVEPRFLKPDWSRDRLVHEIHSRGIPCYSGSCSEIYLEKAFEGTGWCPPLRLPVARELGETSLMFLVHPTLSLDDMHRACDVIEVVLKAAQR